MLDNAYAGMWDLLKSLFYISLLIMVLVSVDNYVLYEDKLRVCLFFSSFALGPCLGFGIQMPMYIRSDLCFAMNKKRERKVDIYGIA